MRNQCLTLFFQEFNEAGFLGDQGIDPFGFSVESRSDQCLIAEAWYDCFYIDKLRGVDSRVSAEFFRSDVTA
jgi:hypothetical protein